MTTTSVELCSVEADTRHHFKGTEPRALRKEREMMSDQINTEADGDGNLRTSIQALLAEDLNDLELASRLRALLPPAEDSEVPPTTDEATDHPGYQ
jgi:hypothetical protein